MSIVGLVVVLRILLFPLFVKQIKAQRGLQALQPQMKEIQKKYKDDRQKQSEEMMKLYKDTGTNPLSSCLPILVQSPFFLALFHVLNEVAQDKTVGLMTQADVTSMRNATIFGAPIYETFVKADSLNVKIVAAMMILLMTASTFITQRQLMVKNMPTGADNPMAQQQKILLYVFPRDVRRVRHQLPDRCPHLLVDHQRLDDGPAVLGDPPQPDARVRGRGTTCQKRKAAKARDRGEPVPVPDVPEAPAVVRTQPKRQSKSQRKGGPRTGSAGSGSASSTPETPPHRLRRHDRRGGLVTPESAVTDETPETDVSDVTDEVVVAEESAPAPDTRRPRGRRGRRGDAPDGDTSEAGPVLTAAQRLEQEGDIAADYLEGLLDIADLDGDIDMDVEGDRAMVSIVGSDITELVGRNGEVLDALQELTRLAVLRETGERSRLMLDVAGHRARLREELTVQGTKASDEARASGEPVRLRPMTPFERKIVHDAVAAAGLTSESEGVEPGRYVVVLPR